MANAEDVDQGYLYGKIVRIYPERVATAVVSHYEELGFPSGTLCKVVMVSRFGDCGLTKDLAATNGYQIRVEPEMLEEV